MNRGDDTFWSAKYQQPALSGTGKMALATLKGFGFMTPHRWVENPRKRRFTKNVTSEISSFNIPEVESFDQQPLLAVCA